MSSAAVQAALGPSFAQARAANADVVRWWVFEGDPWQISRDAQGVPTALNPAVYADFDAALALAQTYDLYYDFVLFSAPTSLPGSWLTDTSQRAALVSVLTPLFAHYATNPRVLSWEVFNEPEWDIWNGKIAQAPVQATVKAIADAVHANSRAYVTVGSAMLDGLPMWLGQGLDYYQAHWYDYMSGGNYCAICWTYAQVQARYSLDAPLVIGEFYAGSDVDALGRFNYWYQNGYAGGWPWSMFPDRTSDHMAINWAAATTFGGQYADLGPRQSASIATATSTATATATRTATASPTATSTPPRQPTSTPSPTAPPTVTATLTVTATRTPVSSSATATPTAAPHGNGRRVRVTSAPSSNGTLQITLAADAADCGANNQLVALRFGESGPLVNALVDLPRLSGLSVEPAQGAAAQFTGRYGSFTVNLPPGTQQVTFSVRRQAAGQASTVPVTVIDGCGNWPTFVGGGPSAF